ncbi:MAG TPA: hypothetical protein VMZ53_06190 [Kofleriaceae bacterium]|nr:hypothetical protein [Kofleriaceae bacterium]
MRRALLLAVTLASLPAAADPPPRYVPGETIVIEGKAPIPKVAPHPKKNYHRMAPPYSDEAILKDAWSKAWVLLDIDAHGVVKRVKLLKRPGYGLDEIAIAHAMKMRFDPAEDAQGYAIPTQLLWSIEWPSYWWLVDLDIPPTTVPDFVNDPDHFKTAPGFTVTCKGDGPLQMGSLHPTNRDCSGPPPVSDFNKVAWVTK